MTNNYRKGRSYCWALNRFLFQDILHDAFLAYHKSSGGKNLFEQPIQVVIRTVKMIFWGYYINRRFVRNRKDAFTEFEDQLTTTLTPEQQFIDEEELTNLIEQIKKENPRTSKQMITSLNMKLEGYEQQEIAEHLGVKKSLITYYFKKIRKMQINSPFNGSKITMKSKITRKVYEANPDKYGEFVYDPERGCDCNEFYVEAVNPQGEYILIREKAD